MAILLSKRILVSNVMARNLDERASIGLERSCVPSPGDWIRLAPPQHGFERLEAFFSGHAYDPHRHDTYAIGYTVAGVQTFTYRGARADSATGHAMVLHPDERHDGRAGVAAGFRYRMAYIEPRLIRDALAGRATSLPFVRAAVSTDRRLVAALGTALAGLDRPLEPLEATQALIAIADALLALDASARAGASRGRSVDAGAVERARSWLDAHFDRQVGSEELEAATGLDRFALARQFRLGLGTSPYRYLTMRRLDRAKAAIRAGQSLADAALVSGFADQSHLTRQFGRAFGLTPGRWRAMHRPG